MSDHLSLIVDALNRNSRRELQANMFRDPEPCPLCGVPSLGFPVLSGLFEKTLNACNWPNAIAWAYRMDLKGWICAKCNLEVGPDTHRAAHSEKYKEDYHELQRMAERMAR